MCCQETVCGLKRSGFAKVFVFFCSRSLLKRILYAVVIVVVFL